MASYNTIYDVWQSETLRKQIVIAVLKAAYDISNEAAETANHTARESWAHTAFADPHLMALKMSGGVIMNGTVQAGSATDNDVQFVVNGLINLFAE